jgi:hypothetical protein
MIVAINNSESMNQRRREGRRTGAAAGAATRVSIAWISGELDMRIPHCFYWYRVKLQPQSDRTTT